MKKILIGAAAVMFGIAANAATYNWTFVSSWVSPDDNDPLEGATLYAFDANAYASSTIIAALDAATDGGVATLANALGSGIVDANGEVTVNGSGLTDNGATPPYASMFGLLVDEDKYYLVDGMSDVKITDTIAAGAKAGFNAGDLVTGDTSTWSTIGGGAGPSPIPEPTSGLLLLLGVAGLALRRKQA